MTFNEQFFDASLRHQIDLLRFGSGVAKRVNALLDETRADLRRQVERRLGKVTGITGASLKRLRELERAIDQRRSGAWNDVTEEWTRTALDVALEEPLFVGGQLTSILPVELDLVQPSDATLRALVTTRPFQGRHLREWAQSAQRADLQRIHSQIRIGMVQGESARDIATRVFGERGAMSITRHQAEAVTRTVINGVSNAAQQEFLQANADLFDVEQYVATLDARTTPICRSLDGKQFPIGKGPVPPSHVACRSLRVAVLDGEVIGERPFKAGTEQQMLREYGERNGLGRIRSRDDLPRGHKRTFDEFSRRRMRELTGQVPAKTTYQEWLRGQPAEIQDDILGPARGKLFREGGLTLDRFVSRDGDELTLDELRQRNRAAFERAGMGQQRAPSDGGRSQADRERERAEQAERERREAEERAFAEAERRRREEEARRAAEEAAREAERRRREAERQAREERERQAELDRIRLDIERAEAEKQRREADSIAALSQHTRSVGLVDGPDAQYTRIAADTISRIRPAGTAPLNRINIHRGKNLTINAYGKQVSVDGYYEPELLELHLASDLPVHGQALSDRVYNTGDVSKTKEEAFARLVTHEYGHYVHMSTGDDSEVDAIVQQTYRRAAPQGRFASTLGRQPGATTDPEGAPSRYGTANHLEFWAESFTAYHFDRDWLRDNKPDAYSMVETVLGLLNR